jgi:hypothetical protein
VEAPEFALTGAGVDVVVFALADTGLAAVASAGAVTTGAAALFEAAGAEETEVGAGVVDAVLVDAGAVAAGLVDAGGVGAGAVGEGAVCAGAVCAEAVGAGAFEAAAVTEGAVDDEFVGEVETTTVVDLTSVVVQPPDVVGALDAGAAAAGAMEVGAAAAGVLAEVTATAGAGAAGAGVELPVLGDTFEPAGAAGDDGGCCGLADVIVVSLGAVTVVSRRAVAVFDALRTLSGGRAGEEADRAVARRTCSIIAE